MGLYDFMYLVPKERYQSLTAGKTSSGGGVENVQESQVNNFEVSQGGVVVIKDDKKFEGEELMAGTGKEEDNEGKRKEEKSNSAKAKTSSNKKQRKKDDEISDEEGYDDVYARRDHMRQLASQSNKLKAAGRIGSVLRRPHSLRRQVLARNMARPLNPTGRSGQSKRAAAPRGAKEAEKAVMQELMRKRLDQLNGGKAKRARTGSISDQVRAGRRTLTLQDGDLDRRIVHELRQTNKNDLRRSAARKYLGSGLEDPDAEMTTLEYQPRDVYMHPPLAGKKRGGEALRGQPPKKASGRSGAKRPKVASFFEDDEMDFGARKRKRKGLPPPRASRRLHKRAHEEEDEDDEDYADLIASKRRRKKGPPLKSRKLYKRRYPYDDEEEEEEDEPESKRLKLTEPWAGFKRKRDEAGFPDWDEIGYEQGRFKKHKF